MNTHYGHIFEKELLNEIIEVGIFKVVSEGEKFLYKLGVKADVDSCAT